MGSEYSSPASRVLLVSSSTGGPGRKVLRPWTVAHCPSHGYRPVVPWHCSPGLDMLASASRPLIWIRDLADARRHPWVGYLTLVTSGGASALGPLGPPHARPWACSRGFWCSSAHHPPAACRNASAWVAVGRSHEPSRHISHTRPHGEHTPTRPRPPVPGNPSLIPACFQSLQTGSPSTTSVGPSWKERAVGLAPTPSCIRNAVGADVQRLGIARRLH